METRARLKAKADGQWARRGSKRKCKLATDSTRTRVGPWQEEDKWAHSSMARAADRRSAGPWFKSGCALFNLWHIALVLRGWRGQRASPPKVGT